MGQYIHLVETNTMCTTSLSLAKPGKAMPGPYSSLMVLRWRASRSGASRTGGPWEENSGQRRRRSDSTFNFKQRQWHAPQRGACHFQEQLRQFVVFTPGSCPSQPGQPFAWRSVCCRDSKRCARFCGEGNKRYSRQISKTFLYGTWGQARAVAEDSISRSFRGPPRLGARCA